MADGFNVNWLHKLLIYHVSGWSIADANQHTNTITNLIKQNLTPIEIDNKIRIDDSATYRTIKALKRQQESLRVSEKRTTSIVDSTADAIIVITSVGIIVEFNKAAEYIFDYIAEEMYMHFKLKGHS